MYNDSNVLNILFAILGFEIYQFLKVNLIHVFTKSGNFTFHIINFSFFGWLIPLIAL